MNDNETEMKEIDIIMKKIEEAEVEQCELKHVHEKTVEKVKKDMPVEDELQDLADFLKSLEI